MEFAEFDIEFLAQKISENPQSPLFARLADLYLGKEQSAEAMKLLDEGIKLFPDYYAGYIVLGKAHLAFNEFSKAHNAFEKALELSPFNQTAAKLLMSVPNKSDESTRTTDENYFAPASSSIETPAVEQQSFHAEPVEETPQHIQFESPSAEEMDFTQSIKKTSGSTYDQPTVQTNYASLNESIYDPVGSLRPKTFELTQPLETFPTYDDYFAQNQSRINADSSMKLDDYLSGGQPQQSVSSAEEISQHILTNHSEEPVVEIPHSSTDIDTLVEKLQSAEKIIPQENYQPIHPPPQNTQDTKAYETDAVTPTLAEIYASQGELRAAIQAYEILMFSQPAKGGEFQQRIRELQQLQMEKDGLI